MKSGIVALVISGKENPPHLVEALSDDDEILFFQGAVSEGLEDPLTHIHARRVQQEREDNNFGDYVEELLSQPFLKAEIKQHAIQWLKSRLRIEEYRRRESMATQTIAEYAFRLYCEDQKKVDFTLRGPTAQVRILVFRVQEPARQSPSGHAA